tara:strand:- start:1820 stop:2140 length:321 start_codon:yes stop_codon:yes gene_type:complete
MFDNFDDNEMYERAVEIDKLWAAQEEIDLKDLLRSRGGRAVVWRILSICGIDDGIPTDNDVLRNLGKRDVGLQLRDWVFTSDAAAYSIMQSEAHFRAKEREERLDG